jgi:hypothetical protein
MLLPLLPQADMIGVTNYKYSCSMIQGPGKLGGVSPVFIKGRVKLVPIAGIADIACIVDIDDMDDIDDGGSLVLLVGTVVVVGITATTTAAVAAAATAVESILVEIGRPRFFFVEIGLLLLLLEFIEDIVLWLIIRGTPSDWALGVGILCVRLPSLWMI